MAVTINELTEDRSGSVSVSDGIIVKTFERYFMAITTDLETETVKSILENDDIPKIGDTHPDFVSSTEYEPKCVNIDIAVKDDKFRLVLVITCEYSSESMGGFPWDEPAIISFSHKPYEVVIDKAYRLEPETIENESYEKDKRGEPTVTIENSAKKPFAKPEMREIMNLVIHINKKYRQDKFDIEDVKRLKDTVNDGPISIAGVKIPDYRGRLTAIEPDLKRFDHIENGENTITLYWDVNISVEIQETNWSMKPLDQGYKDINDKPYKNAGENSDTLYKLNEDGEFKSKEDQSKPADELIFYTYWPLVWKVLDLPTELPLAKEFPKV